MPEPTAAEPPLPVLVGTPPESVETPEGAPGLGAILFAILSGFFGLMLAAGAATPPAGITGPPWFGPVVLALAGLFWAPALLVWLSLVVRHAALRRSHTARDNAAPSYVPLLFAVRLVCGGIFVIGGTLFTVTTILLCLLKG